MPRLIAALLSIPLIACDPEDPKRTFGETTPEPVVVDTLPNGLYAVSFGVDAVGGLAVPFQLDVQTVAAEGSPATFARFDLRAVGAGDTLSEVLVSVDDVVLSDAGVTEEGFSADLGEFVLPGAFSVTGSDVAIAAVLEAKSASIDGLCGELTGELATFGIDLAGSTFGSAPWEDRASGVPTSCETGVVEEIPRIELCPSLTDGLNTAFVSGGLERQFEVVLPQGYDPAQSYPLLFVFHGFGGTIASMLDEAELRPYADTAGMIFVVPQGEDIGGQTGWDAFSDPLTNLDLVLFDDLFKCSTGSFSIDPSRVHVTGMSNGGLFTGYLLATRSSLFASAAPMSGGMGIAPVDPATPPVLALWGGEDDFAFEQDFNLLTGNMIADLTAQGNFVVACDHGLGHELSPDFWPWTLQFLADHPQGVVPEPYVEALPGGFPGYCVIQ